MTKIDFYLVKGDEVFFASRLIALIYRRGHKIHVQTSSIEYAKALDEKLWNFAEDAFIPHCLKDHQFDAPIKICTSTDSPEHQDVFVNLSTSRPKFFSRFDRVAEIVPENESERSAARKAFSFYKERGYEVNYHEMDRKSR
ncbi:DNA polymerase III subunit chi [Gammaproteobacteria bacterium]|nr:DNA polymerase III subunit chi [Gammaproteobacteria bacterium]